MTLLEKINKLPPWVVVSEDKKRPCGCKYTEKIDRRLEITKSYDTGKNGEERYTYFIIYHTVIFQKGRDFETVIDRALRDLKKAGFVDE